MRIAPLIVIALLAGTARADDFADSPGHSSAAMALATCEAMLKTAKSPGLVSTHDFWDYTRNLADARAADPAILDKASRAKRYLGMSPATELPRCQALIAAYLRGVDADKQPALEPGCERNLTRNLADLADQAAAYQKDRSGSITLMRMDLEQARKAITLQGIASAVPPCAPNDRFKTAFAPLAKRFAEAEALALSVEAAAGVRFTGVENGNTLVFVDRATNQRLTKQP